MGEAISEILLNRLSELIQSRIGLSFPRERWNDLHRGINSAKEAFGFDNVETCIEWLLSSPLTKQQNEILASYLTIGETYFFREPQVFHVLEFNLLPKLICSKKKEAPELKVWSAGCCSGEETYSIAILLMKFFSNYPSWRVKILGSDVNPKFLEKASKGEYGNWSFRDVAPKIKEHYFKQMQTGVWKINNPVRQIVTFFNHNLVEDNFPSPDNSTEGCDIIFCRHVLMYFSAEVINKILEAFYRSLLPGGYLLVSSAELSLLDKTPFKPERFDSVTVFLKSEGNDDFVLSPVSLAQKIPNICTSASFTNLKEVTEINFPKQQITPEMQAVSAYGVAEKFYQQGLYLQVVDTLQAENLLSNKDARGINLLARALANQGKLEAAKEWCVKAIELDKMNAGYHYLLAIILIEMKCYSDAVVSLNRTVYLDPHFVLAHISLGNLAQTQKKSVKAAKHFKQALRILKTVADDEVLPFSDGLSCGKLRELVISIIGAETN